MYVEVLQEIKERSRRRCLSLPINEANWHQKCKYTWYYERYEKTRQGLVELEYRARFKHLNLTNCIWRMNLLIHSHFNELLCDILMIEKQFSLPHTCFKQLSCRTLAQKVLQQLNCMQRVNINYEKCFRKYKVQNCVLLIMWISCQFSKELLVLLELPTITPIMHQKSPKILQIGLKFALRWCF